MPIQVLKTACCAIFMREAPIKVSDLPVEHCEACYVHVVDENETHSLFYVDVQAKRRAQLQLTHAQLIDYNNSVTKYSADTYSAEQKIVCVEAELSAEQLLKITSITGYVYFPKTWNYLSLFNARHLGKSLTVTEETILNWYERKMLLRHPTNGFFNQTDSSTLIHGFQIASAADDRELSKSFFNRRLLLIKKAIEERKPFALQSALIMDDKWKKTVDFESLLKRAVELCIESNGRDLLFPIFDSLYDDFVRQRNEDSQNNRFLNFCDDIVTQLDGDDSAIAQIYPIFSHLNQLDLQIARLPSYHQQCSEAAVTSIEKQVLYFFIGTLGRISLSQLNNAIFFLVHHCEKYFHNYMDQVPSSVYPADANAESLYANFSTFFKDLRLQNGLSLVNNLSVSGPVDMDDSSDEEGLSASCSLR